MNESKQRLVEYYKKNLKGYYPDDVNLGDLFARFLDGVDDAYLDFILSSLSRKGITWSNRFWAFYITTKSIHINVRKQDKKAGVFHEIGHGVDFIECVKKAKGGYRSKYFSNQVILSNGKTLDKTVKCEIKEHADEIYDEIYKRRDAEVFSYLPKDQVDTFKSYFELSHELKSLKVKLGFRHWSCNDKIPSYEEMMKNPLNYIAWERYYSSKKEARKAYDRKMKITAQLEGYKDINQVLEKVGGCPQYKEFNQRHIIVTDMLSGVKMLQGDYAGHSRSYFNRGGNFGTEFFADCFSATVCKKTESYEIAKKFLPQSIQMYEELLHLIMEKEIENAKRSQSGKILESGENPT